ncbi:hypothetical protein COF81_02160 [Bacillus pseudomycoides]|uniref:Uncharacterized protein n=1 Tax=Bacillus pseudomycoides TaxID=64104 RepID=A0ABD6TDJ0_9BACI|nr:hypothetical protein [Bacillus pseudomycoides]PHF04238.1 hypothetical protein COF81_02160 [Bacillus pseudomycoides]
MSNTFLTSIVVALLVTGIINGFYFMSQMKKQKKLRRESFEQILNQWKTKEPELYKQLKPNLKSKR